MLSARVPHLRSARNKDDREPVRPIGSSLSRQQRRRKL